MVVALCYVDLNGFIVERSLGVVHVSDTSAISLKKTIDKLLSDFKLSVTTIRGQGYDGASNMRGEFNGLKSLVLKDNPLAFYVHCFAHRLQLTICCNSKESCSNYCSF